MKRAWILAYVLLNVGTLFADQVTECEKTTLDQLRVAQQCTSSSECSMESMPCPLCSAAVSQNETATFHTIRDAFKRCVSGTGVMCKCAFPKDFNASCERGLCTRTLKGLTPVPDRK